MTPEEKGRELIDKYKVFSETTGLAKQCAIICVEQIIEELEDVLSITGSSFVGEEMKHWNEVLEYIKK